MIFDWCQRHFSRLLGVDHLRGRLRKPYRCGLGPVGSPERSLQVRRVLARLTRVH